MTRYNDEELGFIGAVAGAAPAVVGGLAKGLKKVFKPKKKKKNKVIQMPTQTITGEVKDAAARVKAEGGEVDPASIAKAVASTIPGPVMEVVLEALKAQSLQGAAKQQAARALSRQIDASMKPKITAMLAALKTQELRRKATYEHNKLVDKKKFKDQTLQMLSKAFEKLDAIEARLGMTTVIPTGKSVVFGNRNVLEGRY